MISNSHQLMTFKQYIWAKTTINFLKFFHCLITDLHNFCKTNKMSSNLSRKSLNRRWTQLILENPWPEVLNKISTAYLIWLQLKIRIFWLVVENAFTNMNRCGFWMYGNTNGRPLSEKFVCKQNHCSRFYEKIKRSFFDGNCLLDKEGYNECFTEDCVEWCVEVVFKTNTYLKHFLEKNVSLC